MGVAPLAAGAITGGLSIAGGVADTVAGNRNRARQEEFELDRFFRNRELALAALDEEASGVRRQVAESRAQVVEELRDLTLASVLRSGQIRAQAGEGEVTGRTVTDLEAEVEATRVTSVGRVRALRQFREAQALAELRSARLRAQGRIESALPGPTSRPSPLGQGLGILSGGLVGFGAGLEIGGQLNGT